MKKVLGIAVLFLLVTMGNAFGTQIAFTDSSHGFNKNYVLFNGESKKVTGGEFVINIDDKETLGYCVELTQPISQGVTYDYDVQNLEYITGALEAAWLVDQYSSELSNSVESAGLQLAVWKCIYEDDLTVKSNSASYSAFNTYYSSLPTEFTSEVILELEAKFDIVSNGNKQDLLIYNPADPAAPVPEPATLLLLGFGFAGFLIARKKSNR